VRRGAHPHAAGPGPRWPRRGPHRAAAPGCHASAPQVTGPRALAAAEGRVPAPCRGAMAGPGGARGWGRAAPGELRLHAPSRTRARPRAAPVELRPRAKGTPGRAPGRARCEHGEEGDGEEGEEVGAGGLGRGGNECVLGLEWEIVGKQERR
jgi:hypothetical protein